MARYIAIKAIYFGSALAFAPGAQVPADHVERFGYDQAELVTEVDDDFRGDAPHLVQAPPDNTPPDLTPARYLDEATAAVKQAQRAFATGGVVETKTDGRIGDAEDPPALVFPTKATPPDAKPDTGDTTTSTPVTEA